MLIGKLSADELRPYFNTHFLSARLLSKVIVSYDASPDEKAKYTVASLKHFEWICYNCLNFCKKVNVNCDEVFAIELKVSQDMMQLLPSKIDRIHKNLNF